MMDIAFLLSALAFIGTLVLLAAGYYYMKYRRDRIDIVEKVRSGGRPVRPEETEASPETGNTLKDALLKMSARAGGFSKPKTNGVEASSQRKLFQNAGIRHPAATAVFWGAKLLCAAALPAAALFAQVITAQSLLRVHVLPVLAALALLGFYIPDLYLKLMIRWRKERIVEGFPDALDLLVVCVEAGMGLDAAIYRVAEEIQLSSRVISEEFRILNLELRAGKARLDALRNLGIRTDVEDVRSFTTLLIQTDRFGTSVAQALRVHSDAMRTKRYQKAEELAMKLPVKLIFPLLLFIFPAMFVVIAGPAVIQIYRTLIAQ
jgi:tight adherence protein C